MFEESLKRIPNGRVAALETQVRLLEERIRFLEQDVHEIKLQHGFVKSAVVTLTKPTAQ